MKRNLLKLITVMALVAVSGLLAHAQTPTTSLNGAITDPNGEAVAGATVQIKNNSTGAEYRATTSSNGTFSIPALNPDTYIVTISAPGFKQAVVNNVKLDAGVPGSVRVGLEVGAPNESVVIQGGGEVVQTQTANISTTLQIKQIASLPLQSRDTLYFLVLLPGTNTTGGPRGSTINGLPQSTINITIDGLNTQDNTNKTGDGFFSYISPRLDAIEEVTVSTATPGAESAGQGAVQIRFVTRGGNNDFHGSVYNYLRNPWLNTNYWFTNRDGAQINKDTGQVCTAANFDREKCKAARDQVKLNQPGISFSGPITIPKLFNGRNKAFFFVNYEEFHQPTQVTRNRTIFNPLTQTGTFQYNVTAGGQTQVRPVDLLGLAARNGQTATIDPLIGKLLVDIRNSTTKTGAITQLTDPNLQQFVFANNAAQKRYYPTLRLDFNLTARHRLENVYYYQKYNSSPDTLNNTDPAFPGFPNYGGQVSNRFSNSLTLRSTLTAALVNEGRFGFNGGTVLFRPELNAGQFTNQSGFNLGGAPGNNATGIAAAAGIHGATVTTAPSRRNAPLMDFSDNLTWIRGPHSLTFGGQFTQVNLWLLNQTVAPTINFGVNTNDPASVMFNAQNGPVNFPGASSADITRAANIYAVLTGRVTAINANARLDEGTGKYVYLGEGIQRARQRELGIFAQDSWRMRPNLTLNYGLRWELQLPFVALNGSYSKTTIEGLFGVSGPGNLFKPGTLAGSVTEFVQFKEGERAFNPDYKNFAPSFGFAWTPNAKNGWLKRLAGESGQTVVRGGYSIAYNRNGIGDFSNQLGANPGVTITTNRNLTIGNLVGGSLGSLPLLLRETNRLGRPDFPNAPTYPFKGAITDSANIFDPNLRAPYTQSWTFGIQREITKDMAIEVRYVGTRNLQGWSDYDFNSVEYNVLENGLLNEFKLAQANLWANIAAGRGNIFRYFGPGTGTSPLPIILAHFSGVPVAQANDPARYTSTLFGNATFVNPLALNNPNLCCSTAAANPSFAFSLHNDATRRDNALRAGLPANLFLTNPDLRGGVSLTSNSGYTRYDSMQVELRRRLSKGLLVQANYVFAKGFSSSRDSFRIPRVNTLSGVLRHAFKVNWVYELPIGKGKMLLGNAGGLLDRLIGGWEFDGTGRVQSGNLLSFGSVTLVGMTQKEFRDAFGLYFDDANKLVYHLPKDIVDNTIKAFSTSATAATGYGASGAPTGRYLAPAGGPNCIQVVTGQCAPRDLYVNGPMFTRFDLSLVKRVRFTERVNFELRAEFLNAFNNINFFGNTNITNFNNPTFGQVTTSYRDVNNTQDPGGRLGQIVARINF